MLANQTASPDVVFDQTRDAALSQNHPRRQAKTRASVDQRNLAQSLAFYKARFADASNFTFMFVGSFNLDTVKPLVEPYLASLPATRAHETWRDLGVRPPAEVMEKTVQKGIAPKSQVAIVFTIRQELGGTYSITATPSAQKFPRPEYAVRIQWTCDPAKVQALTERVFAEIAFVKASMPRSECSPPTPCSARRRHIWIHGGT